jgi:predicted acylesterase/phospholipase RssA
VTNISATIYEAALATSAATTYFEPVKIGTRKFVDGGLGTNNPVEEVEGEASNIFCPKTRELKPQVKCFISIGTGNPGKKAIEDNMIKFAKGTLVSIATETEKTADRFVARWEPQLDEKCYFRFNVHQGLQDVGLAEYQDQGRIEAATDEYLKHAEQRLSVGYCVENLRQKQSVYIESYA